MLNCFPSCEQHFFESGLFNSQRRSLTGIWKLRTVRRRDGQLFDLDGAVRLRVPSLPSCDEAVRSALIRHSSLQGCDTGADSTSETGGGIDPAGGPGVGGARL